MTATNINRVVLTGNLTHEPELRSTPDGTAVCTLRVASNARRKDATSGEWTDKPNYVGAPRHAPNDQHHNRATGATVTSDDDIPF
jgi:hypothetical protein